MTCNYLQDERQQTTQDSNEFGRHRRLGWDRRMIQHGWRQASNLSAANDTNVPFKMADSAETVGRFVSCLPAGKAVECTFCIVRCEMAFFRRRHNKMFNTFSKNIFLIVVSMAYPR